MTTLTAAPPGPAGGDGFPWLVADVGGTNARFALVDAGSAALREVRTFACADFASLQDAACSYLSQVAPGQRPGLAAFALATVIDGDVLRMTNSPWLISRSGLQQALGDCRVLLLNDFEALALALPQLRADELRMIGAGALNPALPMAVIGPGTGLGVAACVPAGDHWLALATEGGHVTAAAADDFEDDVLRFVRREFGHVSAERLLSGMGLPLLHRAVSAVRGAAAEALPAEEITHRALQLHDEDCMATLDTFCAMLGTFAGNVALTFGARGGLFVAGGIVPRLGGFFLNSRFRQRFETKGRFSTYASAIGTALIVAPCPALHGAAQAIADALRASRAA